MSPDLIPSILWIGGVNFVDWWDATIRAFPNDDRQGHFPDDHAYGLVILEAA
jgi:hypothetical protein